MEFGGVVPGDAPDPTIESEARLKSLPFPVMELIPQPTITRMPITGFSESGGPAGPEEMSASLSYTLWRYPDDRSDPRNELELDDRTRRSIEEEPPWGRPAWLIEQARVFKYPMLWEAVQTTWHAAPESDRTSVAAQLAHHANHVLRNRFREELGLAPGPGGPGGFGVHRGWEVTTTGVAPAALSVDGREQSAVQIDTDPFVYAVGFRVDEHVVCTTVLARDDLPSLRLALSTLR